MSREDYPGGRPTRTPAPAPVPVPLDRNAVMARQLVHELIDRMEFHDVVALGLVMNEMSSAKRKHPNWPTDQVHAAAIVAEEAGELVRAALMAHYEGGPSKASHEEALHTAATAVRFMANHPVESPR